MTTESKPRIKITYATLSADNEDLHSGFEAAVAEARTKLGWHYKNYIDGEWRDGAGTFEARSPIDRELLVGTFATATTADVDAAVAAARAAQPAWAAIPWRERLAIVRRAAEYISDHLMPYSADMAIEVGKNRIEALGEVEESADLLRYYSQTMEDNDGYDHPMGNLGDAAVHTRSVLRPHGVFAVISPFNFPMALATGPTGAALIAGNTVVLKPSSASPLSSVNLMMAYIEAGHPQGRRELRHGAGRHGRSGAPGPPGHRWHRVHRLVRGRDAAVPLVLEGVAAADHRRDGWQEPGDRVAQGRSRGGGRGDHAQRLRLRWAEVLGEFARLRRATGPRRARPAAGREDREDRDRRSARPVELDGTRRRPARGGPAPGRGVRGAPRRDGLHRRREPDRRRSGAWLLRRADRGRRAAAVAPAVPRRAVRAVHGGRARSIRSTRRWRSRTTTSWG